MTDENLAEQLMRIIESNRPALDRMAHGPHPLEQQCQHHLVRQPRRGLVTRYLCKRCEGYHDQFWAGFPDVWAMDEYVELGTGGSVVGTRVRPLLEGEIDPLDDEGPGTSLD